MHTKSENLIILSSLKFQANFISSQNVKGVNNVGEKRRNGSFKWK